MRAFEYASPTTKEQAVSLLAEKWGETEVLAGGTDLLALMKDDVVQPKRLVNIKEIKDLYGIAATRGGLRVGSLVTIQALVDDKTVRGSFPALFQAAEG